jgi:hypothetical protein
VIVLVWRLVFFLVFLCCVLYNIELRWVKLQNYVRGGYVYKVVRK